MSSRAGKRETCACHCMMNHGIWRRTGPLAWSRATRRSPIRMFVYFPTRPARRLLRRRMIGSGVVLLGLHRIRPSLNFITAQGVIIDSRLCVVPLQESTWPALRRPFDCSGRQVGYTEYCLLATRSMDPADDQTNSAIEVGSKGKSRRICRQWTPRSSHI